MDHKLIPHINTGHATHKYLVLKEDAEKFLVRLGTDQKLIAKLLKVSSHMKENDILNILRIIRRKLHRLPPLA